MPTLNDRARVRLKQVVEARGRGEQTKLARSIGLSRSTVSEMLSGEHGITLDVLANVAAHYRMSVADFLADEIDRDQIRHTSAIQASAVQLKAGANGPPAHTRLLEQQVDALAAECRRAAARLLGAADRYRPLKSQTPNTGSPSPERDTRRRTPGR